MGKMDYFRALLLHFPHISEITEVFDTEYREGEGAKNGREGGGTSEVLPLRKEGGGGIVLAMLKGGTTSFWVVFTL